MTDRTTVHDVIQAALERLRDPAVCAPGSFVTTPAPMLGIFDAIWKDRPALSDPATWQTAMLPSVMAANVSDNWLRVGTPPQPGATLVLVVQDRNGSAISLTHWSLAACSEAAQVACPLPPNRTLPRLRTARTPLARAFRP